jgi:hypothetical protein
VCFLDKFKSDSFKGENILNDELDFMFSSVTPFLYVLLSSVSSAESKMWCLMSKKPFGTRKQLLI